VTIFVDVSNVICMVLFLYCFLCKCI